MKNVVVLGAGPAAAVTALLLKRMGHAVEVIGSVRKTAHLEGASVRVAEGLARVQCRHAMALLGPRWQRGAAWNGEYREVNGEHVIDRQCLDEALVKDLAEAGVPFVNARVRQSYRESDRWVVVAESEGGTPISFTADFLVEARGRSAPKSSPDMASGHLSIALIRRFQAKAGGQARTLTEAFEEGWAWATVDANGVCSLQMVVDHDRVDAPLDVLHERLARYLKLIPRELGTLSPLGPVVSRGIQATLRSGLVDASYLRVGDAAYTCDPLSGHGMYEAISGAFAAAPTINTLLTRPDREALACGFYRERAQSLFRQRLAMAGEFYRGETRWADQAFWRSRSELLDEPEPVPGASLVTTPVVEHGLIVERPVLVTPEHPRGVRFVAGVDLADLLSLTKTPDGEPSIASLAQRLSVAPRQVMAALTWLQQLPEFAQGFGITIPELRT